MLLINTIGIIIDREREIGISERLITPKLQMTARKAVVIEIKTAFQFLKKLNKIITERIKLKRIKILISFDNVFCNSRSINLEPAM